MIYPPVETEKFKLSKKEGQYYLAVGRLTPYKRFDLLIDTFNELKLPLVIVGTGKDEKNLKKRAGRFVTFVGAIPDDELEASLNKAIAEVHSWDARVRAAEDALKLKGPDRIKALAETAKGSLQTTQKKL